MAKEKDRASKVFFSERKNALELVNLALRRIGIDKKAIDIEAEDPVVTFQRKRFSLETLLDKMYRVTLPGDEVNSFCLIGLENQAYYDRKMLIRAGLATLLTYYRMMVTQHSIKPVHIVVLNMTDSRWNGPTSLEDLMTEEDREEYGGLSFNGRITVIDPHAMDEGEIEGLETDLRHVLMVIKKKADKNLLMDYISGNEFFINLDDHTKNLLEELTGIDINDGGNNMCKALEDLVRDSIAEGRAEGHAEGMEKTLFSLRKEGYITTEIAAEKMNISVEEYLEKENKYYAVS